MPQDDLSAPLGKWRKEVMGGKDCCAQNATEIFQAGSKENPAWSEGCGKKKRHTMDLPQGCCRPPKIALLCM